MEAHSFPCAEQVRRLPSRAAGSAGQRNVGKEQLPGFGAPFPGGGKRLCSRLIRRLGLAACLAGTVFFRRCAGPGDAALSASDGSVFFFPHAWNRCAGCFRGLPEAPDRGTWERNSCRASVHPFPEEESGFAPGSSGGLDLRLTLRERFSSGGAQVRWTPPYRLRTAAFSSFRMRGTGVQAAFAGCRPHRAEAEIQNRAGRR